MQQQTNPRNSYSMETQSKLLQSHRESSTELDFNQQEAWVRERLELQIQSQVFKSKVSELVQEEIRKSRTISQVLDSLYLLKDSLQRINRWVSEEEFGGKVGKEEILEDELDVLFSEMRSVYQFASVVESRIVKREEIRTKEKMEMDERIVSLIEENRDINGLLRVAMLEKMNLERTLNKLKGSGEQKRVAILQIAERGLQKVGFGFMMSSVAEEPPVDSASIDSGQGQSEDEVVSVAATFENMMKNLRLEIANLRRSLEESRLENEHLQSFSDEQAQKIAENILYIEHLEERLNKLVHNIDELMLEVTKAEEDATRWKQACELEVEAGRTAIEERDKEVNDLFYTILIFILYYF
ncbi:Fatty acid synthase domain 2-containing protein [Dioscorea alata]|uniref:Fatty acid synthase domain 2-containing protein n=2 Tax=Dioscorea alata TaxID=55571 RepID=A0ACB7WTR5_DIOAL|nr:Fatty acid synthase domain 2-containing protein [Dioscorea alata]KAH7691776.1 Fatty acid synthase domain 2-containing protein [Dioscorea alata]